MSVFSNYVVNTVGGPIDYSTPEEFLKEVPLSIYDPTNQFFVDFKTASGVYFSTTRETEMEVALTSFIQNRHIVYGNAAISLSEELQKDTLGGQFLLSWQKRVSNSSVYGPDGVGELNKAVSTLIQNAMIKPTKLVSFRGFSVLANPKDFKMMFKHDYPDKISFAVLPVRQNCVLKIV